MILLSAQPDVTYFHWQIEVQFHNFKKHNILDNAIALFGYKNKPSSKILELQLKFPQNIHLIEDTRTPNSYIPTIRPHIISKYLENNNHSLIFYHDSDIIFRELPDFNSMINDDIWYVSDTRSYLNSNYIKSKGANLLDEMCNIVGINKEIVVKNDNNCGGAQYVLKNVNSDFFKEVEEKCLKLYEHVSNINNNDNKEHPIQAWTADMWAILWLGWKYGNKSEISDELGFSWATSHHVDYEKYKIYHNAGVLDDPRFFTKSRYIFKYPYNLNYDHFKSNRCNQFYVKEIIEALDGKE